MKSNRGRALPGAKRPQYRCFRGGQFDSCKYLSDFLTSLCPCKAHEDTEMTDVGFFQNPRKSCRLWTSTNLHKICICFTKKTHASPKSRKYPRIRTIPPRTTRVHHQPHAPVLTGGWSLQWRGFATLRKKVLS